MKAIIGLGNPGRRYDRTRHNVGFDVIDELLRRSRIVDLDPAPSGIPAGIQTLRPNAGDPADRVLIVKPTTFMNLSGEAVSPLLRFYKIDVGDVLVVVDEVNLPLGKLRARARGSAGGHNGLKSVIAHLGEDVSRLRIGVGRGDGQRDMADHVLAKFDKSEAAEVERMTLRAADAAEMFIASGIAAVMNAFNGGDPATTE